MITYATDFYEIQQALQNNLPLKEKMLELITNKKIVGKVTEGEGRVDRLRYILSRLTNGLLSVDEAIRDVDSQLSSHTSIHAGNNRVFASGWSERLIRTQFSRFYNQAVLELEIVRGNSLCVVPHSSHEQSTSQCSQILAGRSHDVKYLLQLLVASYEDGHWDQTPKIPDHPHCTHVVKPLY